VLDYPGKDMHASPFEQRYSLLTQNIIPHNPFAVSHITACIFFWRFNFDLMYVLLACHQCISKTQVQQSLRLILDTGGEGLVIRENKSLYQPGRSDSLCKLKV
jgi:hypothetical protein